MPWFRFLDDVGVTLPFRNGRCELTFANLGGVDGWAWVAQKPNASEQIVLVRRGNMLALQTALKFDGFEVVAGSPAERVMIAAVKCGHAEELPEDARWRRELLSVRMAVKRERKRMAD